MTVPVPGSLTYSYDEDGITTVFAYPVRFFEPQELEVVREVGGVHTTLTYNVDYTVSGAGSPSGGSITLAAATDGGKIIITRNTAWKQIVDLTNNGRNPAESVEQQLDRLTMAGQDSYERFSLLADKADDLDNAVALANAAANAAEQHKQAAEDAQAAAEGAAAGVNLPTIGSGDAGKFLVVKEDESGYEFGEGGDVAGMAFTLPGANVNRILRNTFYDDLSSAWYCAGGGSDETEGFNDFISAITDGGKGILAPITHIVSAPIKITKSMELHGNSHHDGSMASGGAPVFKGSWLKLADAAIMGNDDSVLEIHPAAGSSVFRNYVTLRGIGIDGNRYNNTSGNGLGVHARNVYVEHCNILRAYRQGVWMGEHPDSPITPTANSCYLINNWVGYCGQNGLLIGNLPSASLTAGDLHVFGGDYHQNDFAGILINGGNILIADVYTWWNRDGIWVDPEQSGIVNVGNALSRDNARAGLYFTGSDQFNLNVAGGIYSGNGNQDRAATLPGAPTYSDAERSGIYVAGVSGAISISGVGFGYLNTDGTAPESNQVYGITAPNTGAVLDIGTVMADGAVQNLLNLAGKGHRINSRVANASEIGFGSELAATISSNTLTVTRSLMAVLGAPQTINTVDTSALNSSSPIVIIRNGSASDSLTFTHSATIFCPNAVNYVLPPRGALMGVKIGNTFQIIGSVA